MWIITIAISIAITITVYSQIQKNRTLIIYNCLKYKLYNYIAPLWECSNWNKTQETENKQTPPWPDVLFQFILLSSIDIILQESIWTRNSVLFEKQVDILILTWCIIQELGKGKATVHQSSKEWKLVSRQKNNIKCFLSPKINKPKNFNVLPVRTRCDNWDDKMLHSRGQSDWVS